MNWARAITGVLVLWSGTALGATLTWEANHEPNLAGYRVYQCNGLPCTPEAGAALLATVEKDETSLDIGIPTEIRYYFVTAYNRGHHESRPSNLVVFTPAGSPPPPPAPGRLRIVSPK
jgi:hypothetical protein